MNRIKSPKIAIVLLVILSLFILVSCSSDETAHPRCLLKVFNMLVISSTTCSVADPTQDEGQSHKPIQVMQGSYFILQEYGRYAEICVGAQPVWVATEPEK